MNIDSGTVPDLWLRVLIYYQSLLKQESRNCLSYVHSDVATTPHRLYRLYYTFQHGRSTVSIQIFHNPIAALHQEYSLSQLDLLTAAKEHRGRARRANHVGR